ncbi:MAG: hypothetical protein WD066_00415 [Planctomycetaceae bacterium]
MTLFANVPPSNSTTFSSARVLMKNPPVQATVFPSNRRTSHAGRSVAAGGAAAGFEFGGVDGFAVDFLALAFFVVDVFTPDFFAVDFAAGGLAALPAAFAGFAPFVVFFAAGRAAGLGLAFVAGDFFAAFFFAAFFAGRLAGMAAPRRGGARHWRNHDQNALPKARTQESGSRFLRCCAMPATEARDPQRGTAATEESFDAKPQWTQRRGVRRGTRRRTLISRGGHHPRYPRQPWSHEIHARRTELKRLHREASDTKAIVRPRH